MFKRIYRTVVAAVLAGAALFSPLLCGMDCLEGQGARPDVAADVAPVAWEFVESGVVGCVLMHVVFRVDVSEWGELARVGSWVWVGVKAVSLVGEMGRRGE
jgi:hypothetical protein